MPVHERLRPPAGHGEVLCSPPLARWGELARANAAAAEGWPEALRELRAAARTEALETAWSFSRGIGVSGPAGERSVPIVMTGHQPGLYHPGVWVKAFLVHEAADVEGGMGLNVVVDTDDVGSLELRVPCMTPNVQLCTVPLVETAPGTAFAQAPVPDRQVLRTFRDRGLAALETLPAHAPAWHFAMFCDCLDAAAPESGDLGALMTAARRVYERPAGTDYLELPLSAQVGGGAYRRFASGLLLDAERFRAVHNAELAAYRTRTGTRSAAQPFPDLGEGDGWVEAPFWHLHAGTRRPVVVHADGTLRASGGVIARLGRDQEATADALSGIDGLLAPKALALTLFERLFVADLFVHGTGGNRYDRVTDAVINAYYGITPPAFATASMTLMLPFGLPVTGDEEVRAAEQALHRLEHNPDSVLADVEFDTTAERDKAERLAAEKARLVAAMALPDTDRKRTGQRIREVNEALQGLLAPLGEQLRGEVERRRSARDASAVLTDRAYPFCLWDPREVMDKVRGL